MLPRASLRDQQGRVIGGWQSLYDYEYSTEYID